MEITKEQMQQYVLEWFYTNFDERERAEIMLACTYADNYHHGTDGHNRLMLIAKLYALLEGNFVIWKSTQTSESNAEMPS